MKKQEIIDKVIVQLRIENYSEATVKNYSFSSMKQVLATIKFLYLKVFHQPAPKVLDIKLKKPTTLPSILSAFEISRLIKVTKNLKHKTILLLIYSGGLRLGELLNLRIGDIDSHSMKIHVRQAKGKKTGTSCYQEKPWHYCVDIIKLTNPMII